MQQMSFTLMGPIDIDDLALGNVSNRFRGVECIPANQASTIQGSRNWICMRMALSSMAPFQAQGVWKAPAWSGTSNCLQSRCLSGHGINGTPFLRDVSTMRAGNSQLQKLEQETPSGALMPRFPETPKLLHQSCKSFPWVTLLPALDLQPLFEVGDSSPTSVEPLTSNRNICVEVCPLVSQSLSYAMCRTTLSLCKRLTRYTFKSA